jgi:hypothetical protein
MAFPLLPLIMLAVALAAGLLAPSLRTALCTTGGIGLALSVALAVAWVGFLLVTVPATLVGLGITYGAFRMKSLSADRQAP